MRDRCGIEEAELIAQRIKSQGNYSPSDSFSHDSHESNKKIYESEDVQSGHEYAGLSPTSMDSPTTSHETYVEHHIPPSDLHPFHTFQEPGYSSMYGDHNVQYAQTKVYEEKNYDFPYSETASRHNFSTEEPMEEDDLSHIRGVYNNYDMEDLPHHSTTMVDYPRKLVTILICIAFFIANMDTSILRQTYAHSAASGSRVLSNLGNVTPAWVFSVAQFLWSSYISALLFFCQPPVIVSLVILFLLYIYMLTSNEPIFSAYPEFISEAEKHYQESKKCLQMKDRKNHLMIALCLLGRNFPGPSKVKMFFLILWQVVRILSHFFILGSLVEKMLISRDTYKKSSMKACVIYADLMKRCAPACSNTEIIYIHLALINTSISLNNSVLQANAYALAACVFRYKYPTARFFSEMMHNMAWRAAKTQHEVFGMSYLLGYSMLKRLLEGRWKEARSFGRVLSSKCDEVVEYGGKGSFLHQNLEKEPIPLEEIHCVPLTFSLIDYATGNFGACFKTLLKSLRLMRVYDDVLSVQHESKMCWLLLTQLYLHKNDYENASYYLGLWKGARKRGFHASTVESTYYGLKAVYHYRQGDRKKALEKATEAVKHINTVSMSEPPVWIILLYPNFLEILLLLWGDERNIIYEDQQKGASAKSTIEDIDSYYNSLLKLSLKHVEFVARDSPILKPQAARLRGTYNYIKNDMKLALKHYSHSYDWCEKMDMPYEKANSILCISKVLRSLGTTIKLKNREMTSEQLLKSAKSIYHQLELNYEEGLCEKELNVVYGRKL